MCGVRQSAWLLLISGPSHQFSIRSLIGLMRICTLSIAPAARCLQKLSCEVSVVYCANWVEKAHTYLHDGMPSLSCTSNNIHNNRKWNHPHQSLRRCSIFNFSLQGLHCFGAVTAGTHEGFLSHRDGDIARAALPALMDRRRLVRVRPCSLLELGAPHTAPPQGMGQS